MDGRFIHEWMVVIHQRDATYTFAPLIQICNVRRALKGISNVCGVRGRLIPISIVTISIIFVPCICLLFSFTGGINFDIFEDTVIRFYLYIGYRRGSGISGWS